MIDETLPCVYFMGMQLILATNNEHKLREVRALVPGWQVSGPRDLGLVFHHEETGSSFAENALGKAETLWELIQEQMKPLHDVMVLADDSGLVVPALGGEPGLYSARYGHQEGQAPLDDRGRCDLLLSRMQGKAERAARFICCLALVSGQDRFLTVQESWEGFIATTLMDSGQGFGYDPVFWLPDYNCTVACLPAEEKNRISHRAKAMQMLGRFLRHE